MTLPLADDDDAHVLFCRWATVGNLDKASAVSNTRLESRIGSLEGRIGGLELKVDDLKAMLVRMEQRRRWF